jgi:hypothetical protein
MTAAGDRASECNAALDEDVIYTDIRSVVPSALTLSQLQSQHYPGPSAQSKENANEEEKKSSDWRSILGKQDLTRVLGAGWMRRLIR